MAACVAAAAVNEESSLIDELYDVHSQFRGFVAEEKQCLVLGLISRVRIVIEDCQYYVVQVVFRDFESSILVLESMNEELSVLCRKFATDSQLFKFCPGIDPVEYEKANKSFASILRVSGRQQSQFDVLTLSIVFLWWRLGATSSETRREADAVLCRACSRLKCDLNHQMKRTSFNGGATCMIKQVVANHHSGQG